MARPSGVTRRLLLLGLALVVLCAGLVAIGGIVRDGAAGTPQARPVAHTSPSATASSSTAPTTPRPPQRHATYADPEAGVPLPDGFVPRRLKPGERPPQFVVVSFDGVGWHEEWQHWMDVAARVPFRFTGFLS